MSVLLRFFSRVDSAFSETSKTFGILPISRSLLRENGYHRDMREPLSGAGASRCQVLARERAVASRKRPSGAGARTIVLAARSHHVAHRHHFGHPWDARPRAYAALADCEHIIHAGDIGGVAILRELETLAPVTAVLGNNDFDEYGSAVGHFAHPVLDGVRFLVGHKPGDVPHQLRRLGGPGTGRSAARRHRSRPHPRARAENGTRRAPRGHLLMPGAVYRPRSEFGRTLAKMDVEAGRILRTWVENLDEKVLMEA